MKKYIGLGILLILLNSYSSLGRTAEQNYITRDIQVDFSRNKENVDDEIQQKIVEAIKKSKASVYFGMTPKALTLYTTDNTKTNEIKQNQVVIEGVTYTINKEWFGSGLRLVSEASHACAFWDCIITLKLQQADDDSAALQKIKARFAADEKSWQERLVRERVELAALPLNDFPGVVVSLTKDLTIKLPLSFYKKFESQGGIYWRRMGDQGIFIDIKDEDTRVYRFSQPVESAPGGDTRIAIDGELFVVKTPKNEVYLERWLASQKAILFRTANGAIYYNEQYRPEAVYFQYDDADGSYVIARASAEDGKLTTVARVFTVLRTLDPQYRGQNEMSLADLALSRSELEARYQIKTEQLFNLPQAQQALEKELTPSLEKPERFLQPLSKRIRVEGPGHVSVYVDIKAHRANLEALMAQNQQKYPKGKRLDDIFIYAMTGDDADYSWYYRLADDVTLEFPAWETQQLDKQLFLAQVFKQLDFSKLPQIPTGEKKNLFKYERFARPVADIGFSVTEGLIDNKGNMLIAMPKSGKYVFEWQSPYIIATFWQSEGEGTYHRTDKELYFNLHGKPVKKP
ncbi:TPA: hypothetical protein ACSTJX_003135 [Serratia fonticola]